LENMNSSVVSIVANILFSSCIQRAVARAGSVTDTESENQGFLIAKIEASIDTTREKSREFLFCFSFIKCIYILSYWQMQFRKLIDSQFTTFTYWCR